MRRFGISGASSPEAAWDALNRLEDFMDETITITDPRGRFTGQPKEKKISEEDIQYTMQKHGLSREEVLERLGR